MDKDAVKELSATESEKHDAFEWLRDQALSGKRLAAIALAEWHSLKSAGSNGESGAKPWTNWADRSAQVASPPPPAHRWVPVSERLPEGGSALCYSKYGIQDVLTASALASQLSFNAYSPWTHWQPLPAAPSSGKEGQ